MPASITADRIRRRLATTKIPSNPLAVDFTHLEARIPESIVERLRSELRPAAVLVPIIERQNGLTVLLTKRAAALKYHAGQISFPGGGMEPEDSGIKATALRETYEEVGIPAVEIEIAGFLDPSVTVTGYAVTAVVGLLNPSFQVTLDYHEVARVFEVPLEFLMDDRNVVYGEHSYEGEQIPVASYNFEEYRIWGSTAAIILKLRKFLF